MFRDIVEPSIRVGSRRAFVLPLSIGAHVVLVVIALIVPVMVPGVLPSPAAALMAFVSRDVSLPPQPPPAPRQPAAAKGPVVDVHPGAAPLDAPSAITPESTVSLAPGPIGTVEGAGNMAGTIGGDGVPLPPPPPQAAPSSQDAPIRIGGNVRPPTKIKDVRPVYPSIAQAARIEGVVIVETTIGTTGKVLDTKLLRSIPLLDDAALEAVRQWEFSPTLLNGSPVPVVMTVTVTFALR